MHFLSKRRSAALALPATSAATSAAKNGGWPVVRSRPSTAGKLVDFCRVAVGQHVSGSPCSIPSGQPVDAPALRPPLTPAPLRRRARAVLPHSATRLVGIERPQQQQALATEQARIERERHRIGAGRVRISRDRRARDGAARRRRTARVREAVAEVRDGLYK